MKEDCIARIQERLRKVFRPQKLIVRNQSHYHVGHVNAGGKGHFAISIVAQAFKNKSTIESHRMVYHVLDDLMKTDIHALQIDTRTTPD